jgi:hypothetical protein
VFCSSSCPPGNRGANPATPARHSAPGAEDPGTARFTKALELKKRRSARCPRVAALVQLHPPKTTAPASWRLTCIALGITWGGLVGDRGHRKGQLRVLGSPSARHTKEPRTGGAPGGRGVRGPDFFWRKSLRTYLRVLKLKPDCRPPGPIGTILAITTSWNKSSCLAAGGVCVWAPLCFQGIFNKPASRCHLPTAPHSPGPPAPVPFRATAARDLGPVCLGAGLRLGAAATTSSSCDWGRTRTPTGLGSA